MKKLLFIIESFDTGGIATSLFNMVNVLSEVYDVSVLSCVTPDRRPDRLNEKVMVYYGGWRLSALNSTLQECKTNKKKFFYKALSSCWSKVFSNELPVRLAIKHELFLGDFNLVCSFSPERGRHVTWSGYCRFGDTIAHTDKTISWIHYDPNHVDPDIGYNNRFFKKIYGICAVSRSTANEFLKIYPDIGTKVLFCHNVLDFDLTRRLSEESKQFEYPKGAFVFFSACRLSPEKGLIRGIQCFSKAAEQHNSYWVIAGDGPQYNEIKALIENCGMRDRIILLGNLENPYPYMKDATMYLNVSYHEAAPMTFLESLFLGTPVLCTRTSSADELLKNGMNALICDNNSEDIIRTMKYALDRKDLIEKMDVYADIEAANAGLLTAFDTFLGESDE